MSECSLACLYTIQFQRTAYRLQIVQPALEPPSASSVLQWIQPGQKYVRGAFLFSRWNIIIILPCINLFRAPESWAYVGAFIPKICRSVLHLIHGSQLFASGSSAGSDLLLSKASYGCLSVCHLSRSLLIVVIYFTAPAFFAPLSRFFRLYIRFVL